MQNYVNLTMNKKNSTINSVIMLLIEMKNDILCQNEGVYVS